MFIVCETEFPQSKKCFCKPPIMAIAWKYGETANSLRFKRSTILIFKVVYYLKVVFCLLRLSIVLNITLKSDIFALLIYKLWRRIITFKVKVIGDMYFYRKFTANFVSNNNFRNLFLLFYFSDAAARIPVYCHLSRSARRKISSSIFFKRSNMCSRFTCKYCYISLPKLFLLLSSCCCCECAFKVQCFRRPTTPLKLYQLQSFMQGIQKGYRHHFKNIHCASVTCMCKCAVKYKARKFISKKWAYKHT